MVHFGVLISRLNFYFVLFCRVGLFAKMYCFLLLDYGSISIWLYLYCLFGQRFSLFLYILCDLCFVCFLMLIFFFVFVT